VAGAQPFAIPEIDFKLLPRHIMKDQVLLEVPAHWRMDTGIAQESKFLTGITE
jgi:hypothetical protein